MSALDPQTVDLNTPTLRAIRKSVRMAYEAARPLQVRAGYSCSDDFSGTWARVEVEGVPPDHLACWKISWGAHLRFVSDLEGRDQVLAGLIVQAAVGPKVAEGLSPEDRQILFERALALLPPRLDRRQDHPRWGDVAELEQRLEAALAGWRAADAQRNKLAASRRDVTLPHAPEAFHRPAGSRRGYDAPWRYLEADLKAALRGGEESRVALAEWPAALAEAEAAERSAHAAPAPAKWHLHGAEEGDVLQVAPLLSPGLGVSTALHSQTGDLLPGAAELVYIRLDYDGASRYCTYAAEIEGLVVLRNNGGSRYSRKSSLPPFAVELLCAVVSPDWRVVVRHEKDGHLEQETLVTPPKPPVTVKPLSVVDSAPPQAGSLAALSAKWGRR